MAGITGMGTTFELPNYHGELFAVTPSDTPLLSSIGNLTGGGQATDVEIEWSTYDLRDPSQRTRVEGAVAPTAEERVRASVRNVLQIHQETVSVSYTKQAAIGGYRTPGAAPFRSGSGEPNPVLSELDWQTTQALKTVALDVNWSFWNGSFANPDTNGSARRTRGLFEAITTNATSKATVTLTDASSATDTITSTAHGLANDDKVVFTNTNGATNVVAGRVYYVTNSAANTFKVAPVKAGTAIQLGTVASGLKLIKPWTTILNETHIGDLSQSVFDSGGLTGGTPILAVNSAQKRAISTAFAKAYGGRALPTRERIGGVVIEVVETDFGTFGIMLDRHIPQDAIVALSIDQLQPVFLNIPGKGVFFEEPLSKTGASDEVQIYGEIGLKWGNERAHGILRGLAV